MTGTRGSRVTIVGGGVMGLMTAYYAAPLATSVTVIDKSRVGDPGTASFGLTRSVRNDYLDPQYSRLAFEARQLWLDLQERAGQRLLVDCGCLNLVKQSVTPDVDASYAVRSFAVLDDLKLPREALPGPALAQRFPQFAADGGWLDVDAGFADVAAVTAMLRSVLPGRGVEFREETEVRAITRSDDGWQLQTSGPAVESDVLVITAGLGTNGLLELIDGCSVRFPLSPDRPMQSKYFIPDPAVRDQYTEAALPVFAYLDVGIYGHPLYAGKTPGVKIGFYHPPDATAVPSAIKSVEDFVAECMPGLRDAETIDVAEASGVDTCFYDLVGDDEFILGPLPGDRSAVGGAFVGVGWRGTGYKFAPWVGRVLAQLAGTEGTVYDISRFTPGRFARGSQTGTLTGGTT
ncbi:MAG: FAD-dependent oxidoreductase [Actinobacteria bacterium]|nr:FAD-dependent oxidoreductase [Actinomycetota bacterium]